MIGHRKRTSELNKMQSHYGKYINKPVKEPERSYSQMEFREGTYQGEKSCSHVFHHFPSNSSGSVSPATEMESESPVRRHEWVTWRNFEKQVGRENQHSKPSALPNLSQKKSFNKILTICLDLSTLNPTYCTITILKVMLISKTLFQVAALVYKGFLLIPKLSWDMKQKKTEKCHYRPYDLDSSQIKVI